MAEAVMSAPRPWLLPALARPAPARCETITGRQIRDARALLCWTRDDFSRATALPARVLERVEATEGEPSATRGQSIVIRHALETAGVEFTPEHGGGVRRRKQDA